MARRKIKKLKKCNSTVQVRYGTVPNDRREQWNWTQNTKNKILRLKAISTVRTYVDTFIRNFVGKIFFWWKIIPVPYGTVA